MAVHSHSAAVEQDRPAYPIDDGPVDCSPDRRQERHQCHPVTLADHPHDTAAVFFTDISDIGTGCFEDP
jgi:hypothetical protein